MTFQEGSIAGSSKKKKKNALKIIVIGLLRKECFIPTVVYYTSINKWGGSICGDMGGVQPVLNENSCVQKAVWQIIPNE